MSRVGSSISFIRGTYYVLGPTLAWSQAWVCWTWRVLAQLRSLALERIFLQLTDLADLKTSSCQSCLTSILSKFCMWFMKSQIRQDYVPIVHRLETGRFLIPITLAVIILMHNSRYARQVWKKSFSSFLEGVIPLPGEVLGARKTPHPRVMRVFIATINDGICGVVRVDNSHVVLE